MSQYSLVKAHICCKGDMYVGELHLEVSRSVRVTVILLSQVRRVLARSHGH